MKSVSSPDVMRHITSSRLRTCFEDIVKRIKPGWSKSKEYEYGFLKIDEYYGKFLNYGTFKLNYLIDKGYHKAMTELKSESESEDINPCLQSCVETQCLSENLDSKSVSAFGINVKGPPKLLNTLIFSNQQVWCR